MVAGWCMAPGSKSRKGIHSKGLRSHFRRLRRGATRKPPRQCGGGNPVSGIGGPKPVVFGLTAPFAMAAFGGLV